ncbi:MAG: nucleoside recognition domain-containing protein [Bacteroidales bacterium]|nr:nucleoside recognition domain-containing protein [Bacteroidales bacterium]
MNSGFFSRTLTAAKTAIPGASRTAWWMVRLVVVISFGVEVLRYFGIISLLSDFLSPFFELIGLPGEASLAFISGYFGNVYAAIAVMSSLELTTRAISILAVMILCAHNMILESAVQKKCGTSLVRTFVTRTLSAFILGFALNFIMPDLSGSVSAVAIDDIVTPLTIVGLLQKWAVSTLLLIIKMIILIFGLSIMQRLLSEFGIIRLLSKLFRPLLTIFGLPARTSFLWIVANVLGLAYGSAVMIEEVEAGNISPKDADLLNHHIGVSHSNLEDVFLCFAAGALFWWMLLSRWAMSLILVWERRLERIIVHKI